MKPILLVLLLSSTAVSACPTRADLAFGIKVTEEGPGVQVFRDIGNSIVSHNSTYPDGLSYDNELVHGVYVSVTQTVYDGQVDPSSRLETAYAGGIDAVPVPASNLRWTNPTRVTDISETYDEAQNVLWGEEISMFIGACRYEIVPGTIRYASKFGKTTETIVYLKDVGIGLLTSYQYDNDPRSEYSYTDIETVR